MAQTKAVELNFRDYWRILRKQKFLIMISVIVVVSATLYYGSKEKPVYQTNASIKIEERRTVAEALTASAISTGSADPMETVAKVIESRPVSEKTAKYLGLIHDGMSQEEKDAIIGEVKGAISTEKIEMTNIIKIVATHQNPEFAMKVANATAEVFVQRDLEEKNKQTRKVREFIENQLSIVEKKLHDAEEKVRAFKANEPTAMVTGPLTSQLISMKTQLAELLMKATEKHPDVIRLKENIAKVESELKLIPGGETEYARLDREVRLNEGMYTLFKQKFEEARIAEAEKVSDVTIIDYATLPGGPITGGKKVGVFLGGMIGLLIGFVLAFVVENLDMSIRTIEGVEALLAVPVLAVIPHHHPTPTGAPRRGLKKWQAFFPFMPQTEENYQDRLIVHDKPKSPIAEAYRSLRTNIKLVEGTTAKALVVTSSGPREGKTTVLINLGLTAAQMGAKTLLVDTDLRRPTIYKSFFMSKEPGIDEVISGGIAWQDAIRGLSDMLLGGMTLENASKTPGLDHLFILPSGRISLNPSEILGSREMARLMEEFKKNFDVILYDAPPILPVTDAALLASKVEGVLIVYEIGRTARSALLRAKQQMEAAGGKVLGVVLNHIKSEADADASYAYYHYKYYGQEKNREMKEAETF